MKYRDVDVSIDEGKEFKEDGYVVRSEALVYRAESRYGRSFANNGVDAFRGAQAQIDRAKDGHASR